MEGKSGGNVKKYRLPGAHREVLLRAEDLISCPERLFQPVSIGDGQVIEGLHKSIIDSISRCDQQIRLDLFKNVVLAGGTTLLEGFRDRVKKELTAICPNQINIVASADRKFSQWLGGSLLSNVSSFNHLWVTRD